MTPGRKLRTVVVGAGPAGVRVVEQLVQAGLRPVWIEESPDGGGRIYQKPPPGFARTPEDLYGDDAPRARALHATLDALKPQTDWRPDTLVWNIRPQERRLHLLRRGRDQQVADYDALFLCTGAMDRVLPFPGWTTPGVTTLGGAQIALKAQGVAIGRRVVLLGTGPLLLLAATQYVKAGAQIVAVLDTAPFAGVVRAVPRLLWNVPAMLRGMRWLRALKAAGVPVHHGITPLAVEGGAAVAAIRWRDTRGEEHRAECDAVGMGWGLKPETQLADLAGVPFRFDALQRLWLPEKDLSGRTPVPGVYLAGDGASIGGALVAELAGTRAGLAMLDDAALLRDPLPGALLEGRLRREARFRGGLERAFPYPAALAAGMPDQTLLCRCEAITAGELRATARDDYASGPASEINRAKSFVRMGMGRCQGRVCGPPAAEVLADALGCGVGEVGRLRGQMPVKPIPMMPMTEATP